MVIDVKGGPDSCRSTAKLCATTYGELPSQFWRLHFVEDKSRHSKSCSVTTGLRNSTSLAMTVPITNADESQGTSHQGQPIY